MPTPCFTDMTGLRILDLSHNNIQVLAGGALSGLRLNFLYIENNPQLTLRDEAFQGMTTGLLSLKECGLNAVKAELFSPLNTLKKLKLENNRISRFDSNMLTIFRRLELLRIHNNPLICDCESRWLKEFYDLNRDTVRDRSLGNVEEPRCSAPEHVEGQFFHLISQYDFSCVKPTLSANVSFTKEKGILSCTSRGNPLPEVIWYKPTGEIVRSNPDKRLSYNTNQLELSATDSSVKGLYTCMATNDAGNITLSVNVEWPFQNSSNSTPCQQMVFNKVSGEEKIIETATKPQTSEHETTEPDLIKMKYFTIVDLIGAILGTFICTLVITVVTLHFCVYRRKDNTQYATSSVSDYSSSSGASDKNTTYPVGSFHPMMQHTQLHMNNQRPLPLKPYHKLYDQHHYMSTNIDDNNTFIPLPSHSSQGRMTPSCDSCPACRPISSAGSNQLS